MVNYNSILEKSGLSKKESRVYLTLLEFGERPVSFISRKSNINRTTCYTTIESLIKKGLVNSYKRKGIKYFSALPIVHLFKYLERREEEISKKKEIIQENIKHFDKLGQLKFNKTKVFFYEGIEGLKSIYEDTLNEESEILTFISLDELTDELNNYLKNSYLPKRIEKGIKLKSIENTTTLNLEYKGFDEVHLREKKVIDTELPFNVQVYIYLDKIAFISYSNYEYSGIIVHDQKISSTMRTIHSIMWNNNLV